MKNTITCYNVYLNFLNQCERGSWCFNVDAINVVLVYGDVVHVSCRLIEGKFLIKCMHTLHTKFKLLAKNVLEK